jgi:gliding motility-associated-like protein
METFDSGLTLLEYLIFNTFEKTSSMKTFSSTYHILKTKAKAILVFLMLFMGVFSADASHVVGGELYYNRVLNQFGNVRYEIVFKIYFDCQNANPGTIDRDGNLAYIGVFDAVTNARKQTISLNNGVRKVVNSVNYECVKEPSGVCVVQYTYKKTVFLNPGTNGLILSHQLCCRNAITDNVNDAGNTGSTYWSYIPPSNTNNSSPRFKNVPPTYVCINAPLTLDYSAEDPDGDSLVYEFYTPFLGGSATDPKPENPSPPPYALLTWNPSFSSNNQVTGSPSSFINRQTGEYTLTPTAKGTYAVGVRVLEYRNGNLLGSTLSDYQFTVIDCQFDVIANFNIPGGTAVGGSYAFECGDTARFNNISNWNKIKTPKVKFFWDFGDPTTNDDTLTTFDLNEKVEYIYPGNGNYTVTLTIISSICNDTYKYSVRIRSTRDVDLGPDRIFCEDFSILLDTKASDAIAVDWNTGAKGSRLTVSDTGTYIPTVSYGKCLYKDTIQLKYDKVPTLKLPKDTLECDTLIDILLDAGIPGLNYSWNTNPPTFNQTLIVNTSGNYIITANNLNCTIKDTIRVWQATHPKVADAFYCDEFNHLVDLSGIEEAEYLWDNGSTSSAVTYISPGKRWIQLTQRHCINSDTFIVDNSGVDLELGDDQHFCDFITATLDAGSDGIKYVWNNGDTSQTINVNTPGRYRVLVENEDGCTNSDSILISVSNSPTFNLGSDTTICINSPTTISAPSGFDEYLWNDESTGQSITTILGGVYKVTVTDNYGCTGSDSLFITVDENALPNEMYFPNAFTPNGDNLNELFPYQIDVAQPAYYITIYSRWGQKVFDSRTSLTDNWDGTYQGKKVPNETFFYYVNYRGCDGNTRNSKGTVNPIY